GKKLMVVPMKKQYEQHYNAAALKTLGVPVLKKMKRKHVKHVEAWIETPAKVTIAYQDTTAQAVERALARVHSI
ncbi:MAG TPA: glycosyl transferase, partial [Ohtaekwangia sp.]|nr:glycosyl transferase [Ohtaekwangia sp.]